ncbi:MAG: vitamin K epoxide reductase family protein [Chlamydiales bacterium]|nr:vitamin K epoxide reductase family protein [Chlamydiales bacterium]
MNEDKIPVQIFFTVSLLGLWLLASTATFSYQSFPLIVNNIFCSIILILLGIKCRRNPTALGIWAIAAIGIWLQFAPLLFWAPKAASYINDTFIGCWVIALAITLHPIPGHSFKEKPTIPPGWSYNPSGWTQRLPIAFFAFICWMLARYLSAYQLGYIDTVWDPFFTPGTKEVLESEVSKAFPISDAGLGAFAYTLEFFSICQGGTNRWRTAPWLVCVFGILVIPVSIVSSILIVLQPLAVGTWCTLCLVTAVCMLIPIPFAIGEVAASIQYLRYSKQKPFFQLLFFGGKCPGEKPDTGSLSMDQPLLTLFKASLSGLTFPWNLSLSALIGIAIIAIPSSLEVKGLLYNIDPILGALITIISVTTFAEYARKARYLNCLIATALLTCTLSSFSQQSLSIIFLHVILSVIVALLSLRKGPIQEQWTFKKSFL